MTGRLRRRDREAFEALVEEHQDMVYTVCLRIVKDGDLSGEESRGLERHLEVCTSCRTEREHAASLERALGASPPRKAPPGLMGRVMASVEDYDRECMDLERRIGEISRGRRRINWWRDVLPAGSIALTLGIICLLGITLWRTLATPGSGVRVLEFIESLPPAWGLAGGEPLTAGLVGTAVLLFVGVTAVKLLDIDRRLELWRIPSYLRFW